MKQVNDKVFPKKKSKW